MLEKPLLTKQSQRLQNSENRLGVHTIVFRRNIGAGEEGGSELSAFPLQFTRKHLLSK